MNRRHGGLLQRWGAGRIDHLVDDREGCRGWLVDKVGAEGGGIHVGEGADTGGSIGCPDGDFEGVCHGEGVGVKGAVLVDVGEPGLGDLEATLACRSGWLTGLSRGRWKINTHRSIIQKQC